MRIFRFGSKAAFASLLLLFCSLTCLAQTKIMCLGNSITQGDTENPSYRYPLWEMLVNAGINFEYVGSHTSNNKGRSAKTGMKLKGKTFDNRNEGHWGWSADELLNGKNGEGKLAEWLQQYTPDMVLMHVGTNDMFRNQPVPETLNELKEIVRLLRLDNPKVTVLLAQLIPTYEQVAGLQAANNIKLLNAQLPKLVQDLNTRESAVVLVDQYTGFDPTTGVDTWDGVHPNKNGEEKMAAVWFAALAPRLANVLHVADGAAAQGKGLMLYPSKTKGEAITVHLLMQAAGTPVLLEIFTSEGKLVKEFTFRTDANGDIHEKLSLPEGQAAGVYLVKATVRDQNFVSRFVVDR